MRALALGVFPNERKNSGRYKHLPRVESQTAEKRQFLHHLKRFDRIDCENASSNRCTMDDLPFLAASSFWKEDMVTLSERNFIGVYIKSFNDGKNKHFDLLYEQQT